MKTDINVCRNCKYYWGEMGGGYRNMARNSGNLYAICNYYLQTGKHRMSDYPASRNNNEWLNNCDKFEERQEGDVQLLIDAEKMLDDICKHCDITTMAESQEETDRLCADCWFAKYEHELRKSEDDLK